jgi:hypothetical protein
MSGLYHMFDAAFPPLEPYPGCQAVAGYIGGNTPHVWTPEEWLRFRHLRQLGIWVADLSSSAEVSGKAAAEAAKRLGWKAHAKARRTIVLDLEMAVNTDWVNTYADAVHKAGYWTWVYGSQSTVVENPARAGYWIASWNGVPSVERMPHVVAHQYSAEVTWAGGTVDLSVLAGEAWPHLGFGPRRQKQ